MDDALAVISASTDNIAVLHAVLERQAAAAAVAVDALAPEQWVEEFQSCRKGARRDDHASRAPAGLPKILPRSMTV
jgi:type IV secretion system protein VirB4